MSAAIDGGNYADLRSFEFAFTAASSAETPVAFGAYTLTADLDCYVRLGITGMGAAVALTGTQPAQGAAGSATIRLFAGQQKIWDVLDSVTVIRVIGKAAGSGTLTIEGPIRRSGNK